MKIRPTGIIIDVPDLEAGITFYEQLLGWERVVDEDYYKALGTPESDVTLGFQLAEDYEAPSWPDANGKGHMLHIDFSVDDLEAARQRALELGAKEADQQFMPPGEALTLLDPFGHPFDLIAE